MADGEEIIKAQIAGVWDKALRSAAALTEGDAFLAVYEELPAHALTAVYEDGLDVSLDIQGRTMKIRPIALVGAALLVRELVRGTRAVSAPHLLLEGSVYIPDVKRGEYKVDDIVDVVDDEEKAAIGGIENFPNVNFLRTEDDDLPFLYLPHDFCRDALVLYSNAYTLEHMQLARFQRQTVDGGIHGRVVTVSQPPYSPFTIFIESERRLMKAPLKQLYVHKDKERMPLLSYPLE